MLKYSLNKDAPSCVTDVLYSSNLFRLSLTHFPIMSLNSPSSLREYKAPLYVYKVKRFTFKLVVL